MKLFLISIAQQQIHISRLETFPFSWIDYNVSQANQQIQHAFSKLVYIAQGDILPKRWGHQKTIA